MGFDDLMLIHETGYVNLLGDVFREITGVEIPIAIRTNLASQGFIYVITAKKLFEQGIGFDHMPKKQLEVLICELNNNAVASDELQKIPEEISSTGLDVIRQKINYNISWLMRERAHPLHDEFRDMIGALRMLYESEDEFRQDLNPLREAEEQQSRAWLRHVHGNPSQMIFHMTIQQTKYQAHEDFIRVIYRPRAITV